MLTSFHFTSVTAGDTVLLLDVDADRPLKSLIADALDMAHRVTGDHQVEFLTMRLPHHDRRPRAIGEVIQPIVQRAVEVGS